MKKNSFIYQTLIVLSSLIFILGLSSCEKDNPQGKEATLDNLLENVDYRITEENYYTVEEMADLIYGPEGTNSDDADLRKQFLESCEQQIAEANNNFPPTGFITYRYEYRTYRSDGFDDWFSAFMAVGANPLGICEQNNIYLVCPYTHTLAKECATRSKGGEEYKYFLSIQNVFIMPDGQGFGSTADRVQPYVDHIDQATQIYDALAAGMKLFQKEKGKMKDDWKLRVIGASQGAGDAMAVHKLLDTTPIDDFGTYLRDAWNFDYSYVCCGPYCPEATMQAYHRDGVVYYPCVVPLVIESMLDCHWNSEVRWTRWKYKKKRFYTEEWWKLWEQELKFLYGDKTMASEELNKHICNKLGVDITVQKLSLPLDKMLSEELLDSKSDIHDNLMECLRRQDLTSGWTPKTKTKIYYSKKDEVVPYVNTERLIKLFGDKCEAEEAYWDGHVACCMQFMAKPW